MVDVASHLRESGFSDDEIGAWAKTTRENLTAAGFKDEEVDDYLGIPKTPKGIPAAFVERMVTGAKIAAQISNLPKAYVDLAQGGYHIGQEAGQETLDALKGVRDKLLPKEFGGQRDIQQEAQTDVQKAMEGPGLGGLGVRAPTGLGDTGAGLFGAATLPFAPLQGVIHAVAGSPIVAAEHTMRAGAVSLYGEDKVRQAEETAGLTPGGMSKEDANKIIDTALMGMGNRPVSRIAMGPGGVPELQQIGGLPKGEDFSNASTVIGHGDTTPAMEGKLQDLYENKGIHPAEVAHDAQTDVTITQSMLSTDKADMPAAYGEAPKETAADILNERQPSEAGAAAVKPPDYSDAQQQVLSKISIDEKAPTAKLTWDKLYTNTMDKLFPLAKAVKASGETLAAEENPYQLARLLSGSAGKADHFLNNGTFDFTTYENNGASMKEILAPVKDDLNGFRAYMASARALELEGRGIKSGFDAGEAPSAPPLISAGLDAPRTVVVEGRNKFAQPLLDLVDYQNRVAAYARDAGVISDAGYSAMVKLNQLYVPFSRVMGLDEGAYIRGAGSSLQAKNPVKSITGSARDIIDPLESIIRNTHLMVEMAERNVVGTKLVDMLKRMEGEMPELPKATADVAVKDTARAAAMADEFGAVGVKNSDELAAALDHATAPLKEGEIAILRDGKRETYNVDPDLANAMKGLDAQSMSLFERILAAPASLLRAGAVLTPQFWARHIMRDYLYATATSTQERGLFTPWDMAKGLSGLIMKDADYWDWMKSGGSNTAVASMSRQYLQENLRELTGKTGLAGRAWNVVADPNASMWEKTAEVGTLPFKAIQKFVIDPLRAATEIAENASHLAAFKKGMRSQERVEPEATNLRDQIIRAGWASRDTAVDAARMGASMRAYNQIFAFGNIKLQDTDRVVRAFKDNPITATALVAGAITVPAVTLWAINHDDPDYQELPQWEKDMFFIVPVGTAAPSPLHVAQGQARGEAPTNSAAMFLRLPKPWAMGMIFGSGVERMLEAYKGTNPTPFKEFGKDLYATSGPDFVPTAAAPIIDHFANRSTFTNRTLIPASQEKFLPEYQYTPYTTELTKELGKVIGAFPGISQLKMENSGFGGTAKAITSPILVENYIRGWTGTLGMYALQAADKGLRMAGKLPDPVKPTSTLSDIPVIQAFVVRYPSANTESVQKFQDDYEKAKSYMTTWQAMAKDGNVAAMNHIQEMADTRMLEQLDGFHQTIGNLNQMVRLVYKNPDIPADEKRQLIDQLYYGIIQTAQGGEHAIHAIREKAADVVSKKH